VTEATAPAEELDRLIRVWLPADEQLSVAVRELDHFYGEGEARKQVLFDNQLSVRAGEIVIMTGPSGSGKTTLLTLLGTLRRVQQGSLRVLGTELNGLTSQAVIELRKRIGFIFQAHNLFESLSATQNVRMATELVGLEPAVANARIEEILRRLGLGHRLHYKPKSLSGGQKQRVAIARGIVHQPSLILADEPTAALDAESGREVVTIFKELAEQQGCTIVIVTHDNRILDVADRIVNMVDGRIKSNVLVQKTALLCRILQQYPLFRELSPSVLANVADKMSLRRYAAGSEIVKQGEPGRDFFVIAQGQVEVSSSGKTLTRLGPGGYFGEVSLLTEQPRNATVRALEEVACFLLAKEDFQGVVAASGSFEQQLRQALFERQ
jgi:putative ABC transport system ATP-binding protein